MSGSIQTRGVINTIADAVIKEKKITNQVSDRLQFSITHILRGLLSAYICDSATSVHKCLNMSSHY